MNKNKDSMNPRERFHAVMNFKPFDRLPVIELSSWWDKTIQRWNSEGLPQELNDRYDICRHFGLDIIYQNWIQVTLPGLPQPKSHGVGIISDMDDYLKICPLLYPVDKKHFLKIEDFLPWIKEQERGEAVVRITLLGFFWFPRVLLGIEGHLYAFYDNPELMHTINKDLTAYYLRALNVLFEFCTPDLIVISEDMSYNHGPMLSEELFNEFMLPYYQQLIPHIKEKDILTIVDSDGDIETAVPWFRTAGFDGFLPLERQAGVDIAAIRKEYPDTRFIGAFDKMVMNKGEEALRREFERLLPIASEGGYLISCDHQTPPHVSYEDYQLYLHLFKEYALKTNKK
jgi:hypothetical protein